MAYQGYQNGQANGNYNNNFNYVDPNFGEFEFPQPTAIDTDVLYGANSIDIFDTGIIPPSPMHPQPIFGAPHFAFPGPYSQPQQVVYQDPMMPVANNHLNFYSQQQASTAPVYQPAPTQAPAPVPVPPELASDSDGNPSPTRQVTPSRAPGTPVVLDRWIYFRDAETRDKLQLKGGRIPRITRKKSVDQVDPEQYYGPPVEPPPAWGPLEGPRRRPLFEYTKYGELYQGRQFDIAQMKMYLYDRRLKSINPSDWVHRTVPRTQRRIEEGEQHKRTGLTCWLGWPAAQADNRYPRNPGTQTCRFLSCPFPTIKQGLPRIILDERMNDQGLELDPFSNSGYVHLYCLEKNFDLIDIIQDLDFRIDDRTFKKEESNLFSLAGRDGKLDLIKTYHDWWRREYRSWHKAKKVGKTRNRRNYEETSLGAALLKCKLNHESSARAKTRLDRSGIDITKYWGDLDLYKKLRQEHKENKKVAATPSETYDFCRELSAPIAQPPSGYLIDEQQGMINSKTLSTFEISQYPIDPRYNADPVQYPQYPDYGTVAPGPTPTYSMPTVPTQVSYNQAPPPGYAAAPQWNGQPLQQQPMVQYPVVQPALQLTLPPNQSRKRRLEQSHLQDQDTNGIVLFEPDREVAAKKACHNRQVHQPIPFSPLNEFDEDSVLRGMAEAHGLNEMSFGIAPETTTTQQEQRVGVVQTETYTLDPSTLTLPGDSAADSFGFNLPPVADQNVETIPEVVTAHDENDNSSNVPVADDEDSGKSQEKPVSAAAGNGDDDNDDRHSSNSDVDDEQSSTHSDLFKQEITQDEIDALFGEEPTPLPSPTIATVTATIKEEEKPAGQEEVSSDDSDGSKDVMVKGDPRENEEKLEVPELEVPEPEVPEPEVPEPEVPEPEEANVNSCPVSPKLVPSSPNSPKSPSGLLDSMWAPVSIP